MSKPVILIVDDEPDVLNAVERDLRSHFRSSYRIVKAGSGTDGLDAARQLKQRDDALALFLVDERMPRMSGTQFLTEARKLYPEARKVLLTAYADTEAAIAGINAVGLDHYLMKPWDPPEQTLYPVLDDLLTDWSAHYVPKFTGIRVAGTMWSPTSHKVKDYLSRYQVPYQWIDLDVDPAVAELTETLSPGLERLPVVFFPDGSVLIQPTSEDLSQRIGGQTKANLPFYDVVVIGGGPSGLAAAVYGASEGLRTILIEGDVPGGQAGTSSSIENYLGFPNGLPGADLARRAAAQARRFGAEIVTPRYATSIRAGDPYRVVTLDDGTELSAFAIIIATGMQVRRLDAEGCDSFTGAGLYYGAAVSEAASYRGKDVFVVGGANSAGQGALLFSRHANSVTIVVRGASLESSMSRYLITRIEEAGNITVRPETEIARVYGNRYLETLVLRHANREEDPVRADAVFVFIGSTPRSSMVQGLLALDESGFILTGPDLLRAGLQSTGWKLGRDPFSLETSAPGVFAVGDVRSGSMKRVASAVGEGSAAIGMVHSYLESV